MSAVWAEDLARITEKQAKAMEEADGRLANIAGQDLGRWHITYELEQRPGRGHDIVAWASDGEFMATAYVDVYGRLSLVVSAIELIHNDGDEDHFDEHGDCEHEVQAYQAGCGSWDCRAPECGRAA